MVQLMYVDYFSLTLLHLPSRRCVVVKDGKIIGRGQNATNETRNVSTCDDVHHRHLGCRFAASI